MQKRRLRGAQRVSLGVSRGVHRASVLDRRRIYTLVCCAARGAQSSQRRHRAPGLERVPGFRPRSAWQPSHQQRIMSAVVCLAGAMHPKGGIECRGRQLSFHDSPVRVQHSSSVHPPQPLILTSCLTPPPPRSPKTARLLLPRKTRPRRPRTSRCAFSAFSTRFLALTVLPLQVFVGNLAYSITDEGLKTFFAPFQSDMCVATVVPCVATQTNRL